MMSAAALADGTTVLTGDASIRSRPAGPLMEALAGLGYTPTRRAGTGARRSSCADR